ncbi:MAG: DUF1080 domain-containing protein [Planctomycetales bacterium]|nr:DUF1080 domain-containing protein [Planctomycetales bacterium]
MFVRFAPRLFSLWAFVGLLTLGGSLRAEEGWVSLFNGKDLTGWKANELPENWEVKDGAIHGHGNRSHLFYTGKEFANFHYKADLKLTKGSNSGMYFRTEYADSGWPKGYEAQVNNSHKDPKRTGSLYNFVNVGEQLVPDDTWWTQEVIAEGNHIVIKVNGKTVVDFTDPANTYMKGHFAFQQHDPGSKVEIKNVMVKELP